MINRKRVIAKVQGHVEKNIGDVSVQKLALTLRLHPSHFSRIFKKATGTTCREFLIKARIQRSKRLLKDPSKSIKEIAYELGYKNANHFSQIFKKKQRVTPTKYRESKNL